MLLQEKNGVYRIWMMVFLFSFLLGILVMNCCNGIFLNEEGIFNASSINRLKYVEVESSAFFPYVLKQRLKGFLLLGVLSTTCFGIAAAYLCIAWEGILGGMLLTAAFIRFGLKGFLLILAVFFPQQFLFIPAGVMMLGWCYQNCSFIYYPGKCGFPLYRNKKTQYVHQGMMLLWIIGVVIIGCIFECYINPIFLTDIIKFF